MYDIIKIIMVVLHVMCLVCACMPVGGRAYVCVCRRAYMRACVCVCVCVCMSGCVWLVNIPWQAMNFFPELYPYERMNTLILIW